MVALGAILAASAGPAQGDRPAPNATKAAAGMKPSSSDGPPALSFCCVGDSITEGRHSAGAVWQPHTYRVYLPDLLAGAGLGNVVWSGTKSNAMTGTNGKYEAYSGNSAGQIADNYIRHKADCNADFLLLHAGHNYDATKASAAVIIAAATNAHARIIAAAREVNPKVTILDAKVITSAKLPKYGYIPALNEAIGALAAELDTPRSRVIAVDMAAGWDPVEFCMPDKVHPAESGARLMAQRWFAAIAEVLGIETPPPRAR